MGRKIKKAITVVIAGMVIGSQFADMSAVGSIVQAEAGDHREAEKETDPEEDKDENKNPEEDKDSVITLFGELYTCLKSVAIKNKSPSTKVTSPASFIASIPLYKL